MSEIKAGELGIIVHSLKGLNLGKIVQCICVLGELKFMHVGIARAIEVDQDLPTGEGTTRFVPIAWVHSLRDTDGADEVNAIAQRKSGREVKA